MLLGPSTPEGADGVAGDELATGEGMSEASPTGACIGVVLAVPRVLCAAFEGLEHASTVTRARGGVPDQGLMRGAVGVQQGGGEAGCVPRCAHNSVWARALHAGPTGV